MKADAKKVLVAMIQKSADDMDIAVVSGEAVDLYNLLKKALG